MYHVGDKNFLEPRDFLHLAEAHIEDLAEKAANGATQAVHLVFHLDPAKHYDAEKRELPLLVHLTDGIEHFRHPFPQPAPEVEEEKTAEAVEETPVEVPGGLLTTENSLEGQA